MRHGRCPDPSRREGVPDRTGGRRDAASMARAHSDVTAAMDVVRLQARGSGLLGKPFFVVTYRALVDARRDLGADASDGSLFGRVAEAQGAGLRWEDRTERAKASWMRFCIAGGGSFAYTGGSCVFLDETDCTRSDDGIFGWHGGRMLPDTVLFHEIGHLAQEEALICLEPGYLPLLPKKIRSVYFRHDQECFADAFAVGALLLTGYPAAEVERWALRKSAQGMSARTREIASLDPYWRDRPEWKAIYLTARAVRMALRRATGGSTTPLEVARGSRLGAFPPDVLAEVMEDRYPDWLSDFDPSGHMAGMVAQRDSAPTMPAPDFARYPDPVDDLVSFTMARSAMIADGAMPEPVQYMKMETALKEACTAAAFPRDGKESRGAADRRHGCLGGHQGCRHAGKPRPGSP